MFLSKYDASFFLFRQNNHNFQQTRNFAKLIAFRIVIADMDLISSNVKYS